MSDLKKQLIKLGSTNPELRPHIRAVLASTDKRAMKFGPQTLEKTLADMNDKIATYLGGNFIVGERQGQGISGRTIIMGRDAKVTADAIMTSVMVQDYSGNTLQELKVRLNVSLDKPSISGKVGNKNIFPIKIRGNEDFSVVAENLWESILDAVLDQVG